MLKRDVALDRLSSEVFDLLVIGGGITGAGIALDAAARGMKVALLEKLDFASGTSSKSSKLIHGGLRYLETRDFGLMREAAAERDRLRRLAPHLVRPLPFFLPEWSGGKRKAGVGLWIYDVLAGFRNFKRHEHVDSARGIELIPFSRRKTGGYLYYDSVTDDVRLTLAVLEEAGTRGAVSCNHSEVVEFLAHSGGIAGALVTDRIGGGAMEIRAEHMINATGVWADTLRNKVVASPEKLRPSKGVHILLPRSTLPLNVACLIPAGKRRLFFVVPWRSSILVGTTDTEFDGPLDSPSVSPDEIDWMLESLTRAFDREFTPSDIVGAYAGLRPLLADATRVTTRDLSRRHAIFEDPSGLITITGGKLTTYRKMAADAVDMIASGSASPTSSIRIRSEVKNLVERVNAKAGDLGLDSDVSDSLVRAYGDGALEILDLAAEELDKRVTDELPYIEAEIAWAVRREMAVTVEDVLARRLRLALEDRNAGLGAIELVGAELGLSSEEVGDQAFKYQSRIENERGLAVPR